MSNARLDAGGAAQINLGDSRHLLTAVTNAVRLHSVYEPRNGGTEGTIAPNIVGPKRPDAGGIEPIDVGIHSSSLSDPTEDATNNPCSGTTIQRTLGDFLTGIKTSGSPGVTPTTEYNPPSLPQINPQNTMRLCFQKVRGNHPRTALDKWMEAMSNIKEHHIGVIGISEINTNMNIDANLSGISRGLQSRWKNMKITGGSCSGECTETHLQGGTLISASEGYENRVRNSKPDPQHME